MYTSLNMYLVKSSKRIFHLAKMILNCVSLPLPFTTECRLFTEANDSLILVELAILIFVSVKLISV